METTNENSYILTVRLQAEGLVLSVREESWLELSSKTVQTPVFTLSASKLVELLETESEINNCKVRVILETDNYVFVPAIMFGHQDTALYLNFQNKVPKNEKPAFNAVPGWDVVNVFSVPVAILQAITQLYPGVIIEHHMSAMLSDKVKGKSENELHLWLRNKMLDVILLKDRRLHLLNSFACNTTGDFVYHAMNVVEQLAVDTQRSETYIYNATDRSEVESLLSNYLLIANE